MSPEKAKRRNSAALWRFVVLQILQTENLKRKNTRVFRVNLGGRKQKASQIDWRRYFLISAHHYSRREQLHKRSLSGTTSQMTAGSGFTSKSQLEIPWRAASPREDVKLSLTAQWSEDLRLRYFFCPNSGKKMVAGPRIELGTRGFSVPCSTDWAILPLVWRFSLSTFLNISQFLIVSSRFLLFFEKYSQIIPPITCPYTLSANRESSISKENHGIAVSPPKSDISHFWA